MARDGFTFETPNGQKWNVSFFHNKGRQFIKGPRDSIITVKGKTSCVVSGLGPHSTRVFHGMAWCSRKDEWNDYIGKKVAFANFLKTSVPRHQRLKFWVAFVKHGGVGSRWRWTS